MLSARSVGASAFASRLSAALVVVYPSSVPNRIGPSAEGSLGACKSPCAEVMLMITPPPVLAQMRYDETREDERRVHVDVELVTPRVERVLVDGRRHLPWVSAALFTSPSTAPKCATVRSTSNRRSSGSETSHATANACPPSLSTSATVSPTEPISRLWGSTVRAVTTTFMPCRASVSATSRPMPRLAPVTMATRSWSSTSDAPDHSRRRTAHSWRSIDVGRRRMTTRCSSSMVVRNSSIGVSGIPYDIRMAWNASTRSGSSSSSSPVP